MLMKAWRIYKIFETTSKIKKIIIKDVKLVGYILCIVAFDLLLVVAWQLYDSERIKPRHILETQPEPAKISLNTRHAYATQNATAATNETNETNNDTAARANLTAGDSVTSAIIVQNVAYKNEIRVLYECSSDFNEVWISILTIYKIVLLMYGIYLAWIIRNINVPSMNDSKYLILSTYVIIVCGLGSMTLMHLLRDWPDIVQALFTIGIIVATCTTQCLIFIPKIRLWYKRKNDDSFKISFSQIFMQTSSTCYSNKPNDENGKSNLINLEEELCLLIYENSQLRNFLKEKEDVIQLLQNKVRTTKQKLLQGNQQISHNKSIKSTHRNFNPNVNIESLGDVITQKLNINYSTVNLKTAAVLNDGGNKSVDEDFNQFLSKPAVMPLATLRSMNVNLNTGFQLNNNTNNAQLVNCNQDSGLELGLNSSSNTASADAYKCQSAEATVSNSNLTTTNTNTNAATTSTSNVHHNTLSNSTFTTFKTEQLKHDLDEVEELTTRVRDSISIDLSNTRRYSPLLYEYYRKQMELAKSIQCTYNIQCSSLFDAMTLMRKCLVDYSQTVHNPEYLAINELERSRRESDKVVGGVQNDFAHDKKVNTFSDYLAKNGQLGQLMHANRLNNSILYSSACIERTTTTTTAIAAANGLKNLGNDFFSVSNSSTDPSSSTSTCSLSSNNASLQVAGAGGSGDKSGSSVAESKLVSKSSEGLIASISKSQTYV